MSAVEVATTSLAASLGVGLGIVIVLGSLFWGVAATVLRHQNGVDEFPFWPLVGALVGVCVAVFAMIFSELST